MLTHIHCSEKLLEILRPIGNSTYWIFYSVGIKLLNILRVGFSHLREHKFRLNVADTFNPFYAYALETECTEHDFSTLPELHLIPNALMNKLRDINSSLVSCSSNDIVKVIMNWDKRLNPCMNKRILTVIIQYIEITQKFDQPLF